MLQLWDAGTGRLLHTYAGHGGEVVCVAFNPEVRRENTKS